MAHMKEDAKLLARRLRDVVNVKQPPPHTATATTTSSTTNSTPQSELKRRLDEEFPLDFTPFSSAALPLLLNLPHSHETHRGLELRIFFGRQLKKFLFLRKIVELQKKQTLLLREARAKGLGQMEVAELEESLRRKLGGWSAKGSRWARDRALLAARDDYNDVYPTESTTTPAGSSSSSPPKVVSPVSSCESLEGLPTTTTTTTTGLKRKVGGDGSRKNAEFENHHLRFRKTKRPTLCDSSHAGMLHEILPVDIY